MLLGTTNQFRRDSVVVSLRAVSTLTGEVILNVQTYKTILSTGQAGDVFRFLDMDTKLLELESGMTENESVTWAVRSAIEAAVLALIQQGSERGYWKIVYPEGWDRQELKPGESATWMKVDIDEEDLKADKKLWEKMLLKKSNGEKDED